MFDFITFNKNKIKELECKKEFYKLKEENNKLKEENVTLEETAKMYRSLESIANRKYMFACTDRLDAVSKLSEKIKTIEDQKQRIAELQDMLIKIQEGILNDQY